MITIFPDTFTCYKVWIFHKKFLSVTFYCYLDLEIDSAFQVYTKLDETINGSGINKSSKLTIKLQQMIESVTDDITENTNQMNNVIIEYKRFYPQQVQLFKI